MKWQDEKELLDDQWNDAIRSWNDTGYNWLIDLTLFLNSEDISTKADSHICRCYSTTNNQDIYSELLWQRL